MIYSYEGPLMPVEEMTAVKYKWYSIEPWANGTWSIYRIGNSMHDTKDGFKSIEEAKAYIDKWAR